MFYKYYISKKPILFQIYFVLIVATIVVTFSCNKDKKKEELALIYEYINKNNINAIETESGLNYALTGFSTPETLEGDFPNQGDIVITIYKGYVLDGPNNLILFKETTFEEPEYYIYQEDYVIEGFEEIIGLMKKGMTATAIVPSKLAYKGDRVGIIPPYSTLVFEIRILDINSSSK